MVILFSSIVLFLLAFYIRVRPRISQRNFGIDSWYFLLHADELRKQRKIPVKLPYFLFDIDEQWYPPVLPAMLSLFSKEFLEKYHWMVSAVIDAIQTIILFFVSYFLTKSVIVSFLAGAVYAAAPLLATQNSNLNSRSLGSLFLTLTMLSIYGYHSSLSPIYLILAVLFGAVLFLSHKFASQQMLWLLIGLAVFYQEFKYLFIFIGIFLSAFILSKGFYYKILKGHLEILNYWRRNLAFLGVHQVYCSPLYENNDKARSNAGCGGMAASKLWFYLVKFQFVFLFGLISFYAFNNKQALNSTDIFFLGWFLVVFVSIVIFTYCSPLKFLGEGYRYFTYGIFPASFLLPRLIFFNGVDVNMGAAFLFVFLLISLLVVNKIHSEQKNNILAAVGDDLRVMIEHIKSLPKENIMSLPVSYCEHIAYFCRKKVLWGAHSSGYDKLQPFFPILLKPVEYFIDHYNISYCLLNDDYVRLEDLKLSAVKFNIILQKGKYRLLEFIK